MVEAMIKGSIFGHLVLLFLSLLPEKHHFNLNTMPQLSKKLLKAKSYMMIKLGTNTALFQRILLADCCDKPKRE